MKKTIIWLLVVILIAGSIWAAFYFRNQLNASDTLEILRSTQIEFGDLTQTVSASGNLVYNESLGLSFRSTGTVAAIAVKSGDIVKKGQVLTALDTMELERSRMLAEIALKQAELNLRMAKDPVDEETVKLAEQAVTSAAQALEAARLGKLASETDASNLRVQAERDREAAYIQLRDSTDANIESSRKRFDTAVEQEAIAQLNAKLLVKQAESQWWSAYLGFKQAERSLEKLQSPPDENNIKQLELQVTQAQLNLDQTEQRIEDASIVAPFEGVITQINIQQGVLPPTSSSPIKIVDKSLMFIELAIDEIDIGRVTVGMAAVVKFDAYPDTTVLGEVNDITPSATNIGGIVSYIVRIRITEYDDISLREGMTASADILVNTISDVLLIPNWAIRTDQETNQTYSYRIVNGVPQRTTIQLDVFGDTTSSVQSGLNAGDIVGLVSEERNLFDPDFRPDGSMRP